MNYIGGSVSDQESMNRLKKLMTIITFLTPILIDRYTIETSRVKIMNYLGESVSDQESMKRLKKLMNVLTFLPPY